MSQGKKLTGEEEINLQLIYLSTLDSLNGLFTLCDREMELQYPNVTWHYYRKKWLEESVFFKTRFDMILNNVKHKVEQAMFRRIEAGDPTLIKFYLERKADYIEKKETKVDINQPIKINIIKPEDE